MRGTLWADSLAGEHLPAGMVARAVRLAATGSVTAARVRDVVADLLDAGCEVSAKRVFDGLESVARASLADDDAVAAAGHRLAAEGARVLLAGHPGYPARLACAWPDLGAPAWLFMRSERPDPVIPDVPAVAVVGTRHPSLDGLHTARELGRRIARLGALVVSGMARGIDQAAHRGALDVGGVTVAVLGTGLDVDYPRGDGRLRAEVAESGALLTEHVCGAPPRPRHFLARNRIIAGLADLTVVVEGRARSGSLQTARLAASQGRDVWSVPGSINAPTSRGPLDLIRDGAQVVTRLEDVCEAVAALDDGPAGAGGEATSNGAPTPVAHGLTSESRTVLGLLGAVPATPGSLAGASGLPVPAVLAAIGDLTARGLAVSGPRGVTVVSRP